MLEKASGESFTGKKKEVRMRRAIVHLKYLTEIIIVLH